jgi:high-affinity iron transporter
VLPTFVIGLREGLEASLIVGIIAAFLAQNSRRRETRAMWIGVAAAVAICLGIGIALRITEQALTQKAQEGLETVIGLVAVGFVTWMILWMRKHAPDLKGELEDRAAVALAMGSAGALVLMAFLAVLREGLETAVFMLAAFNAADSPLAAGIGAVLGILVAVVIGWGIYRGGVRINLARFFKITGLLLVLVAAGLLSTAMHTAHEAGWINGLQEQVVDLTWLVDPGSVRAAILTGMFGLQPKPVTIEVVVWFLYAIPMTLVVFWPTRARARARSGPAVASTPEPVSTWRST